MRLAWKVGWWLLKIAEWFFRQSGAFSRWDYLERTRELPFMALGFDTRQHSGDAGVIVYRRDGVRCYVWQARLIGVFVGATGDVMQWRGAEIANGRLRYMWTGSLYVRKPENG